jgi:hypothetical protein
MTPAMRELLAAMAENADVPLPALSPDAERQYTRLLERRMSNLAAVLETLTNARFGKLDDKQFQGQAQMLREWAAASPVTYEVYQPAPQDKPAEAAQ